MSRLTQPTYRPRKYLSYSTLMSFIRCPRLYFYEKCGLRPKDSSAALVYGSAMHKAVPVLLTGLGLDAAISAFSSVWQPDLDDRKHNLTRAIASLAHFESTHKPGRALYELLPPPPRPEGLTASDEVAPTELLAMVDVGLSVPIFVRMDGWCRHRDTGKLFIWELKTMSRLTASIFDSLEFNPQCLTYTALGMAATGEPLAGVMFEGMLKDPNKVDGMSHPVMVQDHLVRNTLQWLKYWGELLLACEARTGTGADDADCFPKNFAGCSAYPLFYQPGSVCDFQSLCRTPDWRSLVPYYDIAEEHTVVELTRGAT